MGYDLHYKGSNTLNLESEYCACVNNYIYEDFFSDFDWTEVENILDKAPIKIKDDGTADFCFDTFIYPYYDLIYQTGKNKTLDFLIEQIQTKPKTKYVFLQLF